MAEPAPSAPDRSSEDGFLSPAEGSHPVDHCFRCGKETAPGVGLCEEHNPTHIQGPSATQMHATVFGGIVIGVIGFFVLAGFAVGSTGPFAAELEAASSTADGGVALAVSIVNEGEGDGVANCRVTRDGAPRPDDYAFRTEPFAGGASISIERTLPPPPAGSARYAPERVSVNCS